MIYILLSITVSAYVLSYWYDVREYKKEFKRRELHFKKCQRKLIIKSTNKNKHYGQTKKDPAIRNHYPR